MDFDYSESTQMKQGTAGCPPCVLGPRLSDELCVVDARVVVQHRGITDEDLAMRQVAV